MAVENEVIRGFLTGLNVLAGDSGGFPIHHIATELY